MDLYEHSQDSRVVDTLATYAEGHFFPTQILQKKITMPLFTPVGRLGNY